MGPTARASRRLGEDDEPVRRRDLELEGIEPAGVVDRLALVVDQRRALRARRHREEPLEDAGERRASPGRAAARGVRLCGSVARCGRAHWSTATRPRSAAASGATELRSLRPARSRFSAARARSFTMSSRSLRDARLAVRARRPACARGAG